MIHRFELNLFPHDNCIREGKNLKYEGNDYLQKTYQKRQKLTNYMDVTKVAEGA